MYKTIIDYIGEIALRHKLVNKVKYQNKSLINQQHSNANYQVVIEDDVYSQWIRTTNVFTMTINIDILSHTTSRDDKNELIIHNDSFLIANNIITFIENDDTYQGIIRVYDYSLLNLSHFTDDNDAGIRLSLELVVPNPSTVCDIENNFDRTLHTEEDKDKDISLNIETKEDDTINITPIKLPTNKRKKK